MRIVYLYRGIPVSTPLMHIRFMISSFRGQGHEVIECFPAAEPASESGATHPRVALAKAWYRAHMPRSLVNLAQLYEARRARGRVVAQCVAERPDFIYERYSIFTDAGLRAARAIGCPLIQEVNAVYSLQHPHVFAGGFGALARRSDRRLLPQADALIAVSAEVARALVSIGVPAEKITVMHNAVDPDEYRELEQQRRSGRLRLGLSGAFVVAVLQALDAGPFPAELLRALKEVWPRVRAAVPQARLLWIGGGSRFDRFRTAALSEVPGAQHEVLFLGNQPHESVPSLLACGDVGVVLWHRAFCSPMKVFEYMAAGLPVIAPALAGISEIVRDGENGSLFPSGDYCRLAQLIVTAATNRADASSLADRGRQYVFAHHTWAGNATAVVSIAARLIGRTSPR
jgi:glycosyltransferase involved in cell wall biosynthesis